MAFFAVVPVLQGLLPKLFVKQGAIIRDGDRKRAPFLVLGLAS